MASRENQSKTGHTSGQTSSDRTSIEETANDAGRRFEVVGRAGWLAKGLVYSLIGFLFLGIAFGGGGGDANQAGAIEQVAETPFGGVLLLGVAIGLGLYSLWRLFTVVLPGDWTGSALIHRAGYLVSAIVYASLLWTSIGFLRGRSSDSGSSEDRMAESVVKSVLEVTAGRTLVIMGGLIAIAIGGFFARKGFTHSFRDDMSGQSGLEGTAIDHLGMVGWIARGASMALIGAFLIQAAWTFDAEKAAGLDDSVRQLAEQPFGAVLAGLVGAGFICYGAFAALSARHRNLEGPRND